jgi:glycosyltransferase involved in cell wall biosynthesis
LKIALNAMQVRAAKSGVGQYIEGLLDGLLELLNDSDQQPIDPVNHADSLSVCMYCSADNVANYARTATFPYETRVWGLPQRHRALRLLNEHLRLASEVRREGFDVFHGLSNFLPLGLRCPSVVTIHDLSYYVEPERCPFVRRQYWYAMTAHAVRTATRIITPSQNTQRDIERFFPDYASKVRVVPSGVHRRFQPNAPCDSQTVKTQSCHGLAPDGHTLPYFLSAVSYTHLTLPTKA